MEVAVGFLIILTLSMHFIPTMVALARSHHNTLAIAMLNFFLGWTFIGWVIALVWACTQVKPKNEEPQISYAAFAARRAAGATQ